MPDAQPSQPPEPSALTVDTSRSHPARVYDWYLGGKDWFPADAEAGEEVEKTFPTIKPAARANRRFMHDSTRYLAAQRGVWQFVDIGTGIPTEPNLHQIAQDVTPFAHVVYADFDPLVLDYADALMRSNPAGRTAYIQGDVRDDDILGRTELRDVIDLSQPVALSLIALMHFVRDEERPYEIVQNLVDQLCSGSFLVMAHGTADFDPEAWAKIGEVYGKGQSSMNPRSKKEFERFFTGLEMVDPGVVPVLEWHPADSAAEPPESLGITNAEATNYVGVAVRP